MIVVQTTVLLVKLPLRIVSVAHQDTITMRINAYRNVPQEHSLMVLSAQAVKLLVLHVPHQQPFASVVLEAHSYLDQLAFLIAPTDFTKMVPIA